jgi:hypothetical protein
MGGSAVLKAGGPGTKRAAGMGTGKNLPLWRRRLRKGAPQEGDVSGRGQPQGDVSERISDREVQDHITDVSSGFKVPLGAIRFPRSPDGNGNVDA